MKGNAASRVLRNLRAAAYFGGVGYISFARWAVLTGYGRRLPEYGDQWAGHDRVAGLEYSRRAFSRYTPNSRAQRLLSLLASVPGAIEGSLLIIGPRFENEIFLARAYGWQSARVQALDLLTYSPLITTGDMHAMPFADASFDSISCGWTLSYSRNPSRAAEEITRVLAPGGLLALGVVVVEADFIARDIEGALYGAERVQERSQISELFPDFEVLASVAPSEVPGDGQWLLRKVVL